MSAACRMGGRRTTVSDQDCTGPGPRAVAKGVGRAFGGALLFALPLLMTMEIWRFGVSVSRWRLLLLILATAVLVLMLSRYFGFISGGPARLREAAVDAGVALLVGYTAAAVVLTVLAVARPFDEWQSAVSIVAIEALPASIGASFARSQLGEGGGGSGGPGGRLHQLVVVTAGAAVFCANIAPTEEVVLLAAKMSEPHALALVALSLAVMHGFVYGLGFKGGSASPGGFWAVFLGDTVVGYVVALAVSAGLLWTFGRFEGLGVEPMLVQTLVLALPASVGAAAARLIL